MENGNQQIQLKEIIFKDGSLYVTQDGNSVYCQLNLNHPFYENSNKRILNFHGHIVARLFTSELGNMILSGEVYISECIYCDDEIYKPNVMVGFHHE